MSFNMKLILAMLLPAAVLAGGSASINLKYLEDIRYLYPELFNFEGNVDGQLADNISYKASYAFNKDRFRPSGLSISSSGDTSLGKVHSTLLVDPQEQSAVVQGTLSRPDLGTVSTSYKAAGKGAGVLGPLKWVSRPVIFPIAPKDDASVTFTVSHDANTKKGSLNVDARIGTNFDTKVVLPSEGKPEFTLFAAHSPNMESDISAKVKILDLAEKGVGKGALSVAYHRDLATGPGACMCQCQGYGELEYDLVEGSVCL